MKLWKHGLIGQKHRDAICMRMVKLLGDGRRLEHKQSSRENDGNIQRSENARLVRGTELEGAIDKSILEQEEDRIGILLAADLVKDLIEEEAKEIGTEKIILVGASQGAALAIHAGLRHKKKLGGIISIGGYVPLWKEYPKFISSANKETTVMAVNGFDDPTVFYFDVVCTECRFRWNMLGSPLRC